MQLGACCASTKTMCFRDISSTPRGSSPAQAGLSSSESESTCRTRWWDRDKARLDEDILSDTDESDALEALACADGAQVSRKRSLQRTSLEKSEAFASSKRSRIAHGKSTVVDVSPAKRIEELPYVDRDWCIQQRLVRFHVLSKSMSGQQLELITCLSVKFGLPSHKIVAAMRDGAAVYGAALRSVKKIM